MFQRRIVVPIIFAIYTGCLNYWVYDDAPFAILLGHITFLTFLIHEILDYDAIYRRVFLPADKMATAKHVNIIDRLIYKCIKSIKMPSLDMVWRITSAIIHIFLIIPVFFTLFWGDFNVIFTLFLLAIIGVVQVLMGKMYQREANFCHDAIFFIGIGGLLLLCH